MPNLVGLWAPDRERAELTSVVKRQLDRVRVPDIFYTDYVFADDGFAAGLQDHGILENGPQPVHSTDGRFTLFLDGEIFNGDELRDRYSKNWNTVPSCNPELCLKLLVEKGENAARELNGLFLILLYDRRDKKITFISDRYAFRPLFYSYQGGQLLFGTELKAIRAADQRPADIDGTALLELFTYGCHFVDRTWLTNHHRIAPATVLTVDASGLQSRRYWTYQYDDKAPKHDQETYSTVFSILLDRAVERSMRGSHRIGIFLSGGYDSRSVAASIRSAHLPIPAFTFGHPESRDVRFAAMLAQRLGMKHFPLTKPGPYLYPNVHAIVWRTEGLIPFPNLTSIRFHQIFKEHMDVFLTGFLGEYSGSHTWPDLLLARSREAGKEAIYKRFVLSRLPNARRVFQSAFVERSFEELKSRFDQSFDAIPNDHPLDMADAWNISYVQSCGSYQSPAIDRYMFETRAPHMDNELVDFLLTIRPYDRLEQRVYKRMIATAFPQIRDVPCTNSARPIDPNFAREYAKMVVDFAARKASGAANKLLRRQESLGREFRNVDDDFRAEPELYSRILIPLLESGTFPEDIFDNNAIRALADDQYKNRGTHEGLLSRLISWGLAAEFFAKGNFSEVPSSMLTRSASVGV